MSYSAGEIAGFIGAAAWVPQLIRMGIRHFAKPKIAVLIGPKAEIGFTSFGPIFNLRLIFSAERQDVVINQLTISLTHENGNKRMFGWQGSRETFSQMRDASGTAVGSFDRDTDASAFKVTTQSVYDSFFRFQELNFIDEKEPYFNALIEHESFLRASGSGSQMGLLQSEQMHRLNKFHRNAFWWEAGKYTAEIQISGLSRFSVTRFRYEFHLTSLAVEALRNNIESIPTSYEYALLSGTEGFDKLEPSWNWQNPAIRAC